MNFLDPRTMSVLTDINGTVIKWIQKVGSVTQEYPPEDVAHFIIQRDPNSPVFGLSPMEPIFWEIRTDLAAMVSNLVFFENDAIPAAHYIMDEDLTDQEQKRAIEALKVQVKGATNRHKSVAIKGVKDIKQLSVSAKDMEFHVLRRFTTEKVCAAYGVPKSILNYTEAVNLATAEEQSKKFWNGTILPLEEALAEFINRDLFPKLGVMGIKIKFNPKTFENMQWNEASTRADQAQGILTINEVRKLRGLESFEKSSEGEFVDKPILLNGQGAVPVEDVGVEVDDFGPVDSVDAAQKEIEKIKDASERYQYGRNTDAKNSR
jgi:HK97 family phage portal protein